MALRSVSFQDADFPHRFEWVSTPHEGVHRRWVPFGMPRLNPLLKNSVFFLFGLNPATGKVEGPVGSGVIVGLPRTDLEVNGPRHAYAVTARHVVESGGSMPRINVMNGDSRLLDFDPGEWTYHPAGDDIAAIDITDHIRSDDQLMVIPDNWLTVSGSIDFYNIGLGEDGFMLGLFAHVPGDKKNIVSARFGNISLFGSDDLLIEHEDGGKHPSHLFDIKSRPGYSGSPVFIYRTPGADLRRVDRGVPLPAYGQDGLMESYMSRYARENDERNEIVLNTFIQLLGVHTSQYFDFVKMSKSQRPKSEMNDAIQVGDRLKIPNSVALVSPAWRVAQLLEHPKLVAQAKAREAQDDAAGRHNVQFEYEGPQLIDRPVPKVTITYSRPPDPRESR